jgi:hypothetical protein
MFRVYELQVFAIHHRDADQVFSNWQNIHRQMIHDGGSRAAARYRMSGMAP